MASAETFTGALIKCLAYQYQTIEVPGLGIYLISHSWLLPVIYNNNNFIVWFLVMFGNKTKLKIRSELGLVNYTVRQLRFLFTL